MRYGPSRNPTEDVYRSPTMTIIRSGRTTSKTVQITYEVLGDSTHDPLLLISGLGSQLVYWTDALCQVFLKRSFQIIRFDNRDVGLSTKTPGPAATMAEVLQGQGGPPPYTLSDMASDTVGILDDLGIESAHVLGVSLGGGIAQTMALEYPQRTDSLISVMSAPRAGTALLNKPESSDAVKKSLTMDMSEPLTWVDSQIEGWRAISGPHFDERYMRDILQRSFDRCYHPAGWSFQMAAALASGDRVERLSGLDLPTLIIHGAVDPLIPVAAGELTASAIPGARLEIIEDMGHCLLKPHWTRVADSVAQLAQEACR